MSENNKNTERIETIIRNYLQSERNGKDIDRHKDEFEEWLACTIDEEDKERIIDKVAGELRLKKSSRKAYERLNRFKKRYASEFGDQSKAKLTPLRKTLLRVAAAVIVLASIGGLWTYISKTSGVEPLVASYVVPKGEIKDLELADSSLISINSDSKLVVSMSKTKRVTELIGESYFVVAKDADRPFVVKTEQLTITVLGTEFNVSAYPDADNTVVTLCKGKISIETKDDQKYILEPNQRLTYNKTTKTAVVTKLDQVKVSNAELWRDGIIVLDELTLKNALQAIERRFNIKVEITPDTNLDNVLYGKIASDANLNDIMEAIANAVPNLVYSVQGNVLLISKEK